MRRFLKSSLLKGWKILINMINPNMKYSSIETNKHPSSSVFSKWNTYPIAMTKYLIFYWDI